MVLKLKLSNWEEIGKYMQVKNCQYLLTIKAEQSG